MMQLHRMVLEGARYEGGLTVPNTFHALKMLSSVCSSAPRVGTQDAKQGSKVSYCIASSQRDIYF